MVDSDATYIPWSASAGTICDGGKSAYCGRLATLTTLLYSFLLSLFLGPERLTRGRLSDFTVSPLYTHL